MPHMPPPKSADRLIARIGINLLYFRETAGLTQEKLAEVSGLSRNLIAKLETGDSGNPTLSSLTALVEALGLSSIDLLLGEPTAREVVEESLRRYVDSGSAQKIRADSEEVERLGRMAQVVRLFPATNESIEHLLLALRSMPPNKK